MTIPRRPLSALTVAQLLERVVELETMAGAASNPSVKAALETLAERFLGLAERRAADLHGGEHRAGTTPAPAEHAPGEPARRSGRFRLFNLFGSPTPETTEARRGEALPAAPRGYTWRFQALPAPFFGPAFDATPHAYLLLTPNLTIAGANDAYLAATFTRRDDIVGCDMFDVFPDNPDDATADGVAQLSASLLHVVEHGAAHTMGLQRYDVRDPDGRYHEKWWQPVNIPVFDAARLVHVLHHVQDVTAQHRAGGAA